MSEPCYGRILIGGDIPKSLVSELKKKLDNDFGGLDMNTEVEVLFEEGAVFEASDGEANYGHFEALEAWLIEHRIHFDVRCDSKNEWDAGLMEYRGEKIEEPIDAACSPGFRPTSNGGSLIWEWSEIERALYKVQSVIDIATKAGNYINHDKAIAWLKQELDVEGKPGLTPLRFVDGEGNDVDPGE